MLDWLNSNLSYWHWIVLGLVLASAEIFVSGFVLLWFGVSAIIIGVILAFTPLAVETQLLLWSILSVAQIAIWFKWINPKNKTQSLAGMAKEAIVGQSGIVIRDNQQSQFGRVRFSTPLVGSDEWEFRCEEKVAAGDRVFIVDLSGNKLVVSKNK